VHFREGKTGKFLDRGRTVNGIGRIMSVSTRPTYCSACGTTYFNWSSIAAADRINPVGTVTGLGWQVDLAHQPRSSPQYIVTGDYFYLEEMWFWASASTLSVDGSSMNYAKGRGPTGAEGNIPGTFNSTIRGQGWGLRNRAEAAFASPDTTPEKAYLDQLVNDVLAAWEGERNITGTAYQSNAMWNWGRNFAQNDPNCFIWCMESDITGIGVSNRVPSVIHFWEGGTSPFN